jgi:arylsulfatase A-like enzyme
VILVCIDTVRYDTWSLPERSGRRDAMSNWSDRAIRFKRMQSAAPWTIPSVATVLTGMYPMRHGAGRFQTTVADVNSMPPSVLPDDVLTLPEKLAAAGWSTAAILAPSWVNPPTGLLQGVTEIRDVPPSGVTAAALEWLRRDRSQKQFFLYLHYMEAHGDQSDAVKATMAASFSAAERKSILERMPNGMCERGKSNLCIDSYLAYTRSVLDLRGQLAKLLDGLRETGQLDDTLVVIFSDHGEEFGDHVEEEKALANDPLESYGYGHGRSLYQELLHVPTLIWHPRIRGLEVGSPMSLADIEPTILEWTGVEIESKAPDGISFADVRTVDRRFDPERPIFFSGISYGPEQTGVLWNHWKRMSVSCPREEISFRLDDDPHEQKPIKVTRVDQKITALLAAYRALAAAGVTRETDLNREQVASLQAIGYLGAAGETNAATKEVRCSAAAAHDSIGAFDPKSRTHFLRHGVTSGVADVAFKKDRGGVPLFGDWKGTGISTLALFDSARSEFAIFPSNLAPAPDTTIALTLPGPDRGDIPLSGDWDGDRVQTIGVYRTSTSTFYLRNRNTSGPPDHVIPFGKPGDLPVVGDWDGSGRTDLGVFRPDGATFLLRKGLSPSKESTTPIVFGIAEDLPVAGDWNGDGKDTIGLYRPSAATFFLRNRNETGVADLTISFGNPGFLPLTGNWGR